MELRTCRCGLMYYDDGSELCPRCDAVLNSVTDGRSDPWQRVYIYSARMAEQRRVAKRPVVDRQVILG